jgi:hypothetical protein
VTMTESFCWGAVPTGVTTAVPVPMRTEGSAGLVFLRVTAGTEHGCGITSSAEAYCWGIDYQGVLGDGPAEGGPLPVLVREAPDSLRPL